ncbi:MAG: hypothetical protein M3N19_06265 [Candidatus Eremiobacteraeota bacterium]|nr:hypothetical protein [Candidatus Eremiobacteraeota bacterium]
MKQIALTAALLALLAPAAIAQEGRCTREVLNIKGTPVTVSYCVQGSAHPESNAEGTVRVAETYTSAHGSFHQTSPLAFIPGDDPSRVIEDVSLSQVGLSGTLHLTLVMHAGTVHIEAAMLTPGAISIK